MRIRRLGCKPPKIAPHLVRAPFRLHAAMTSSPQPIDLREPGLIAAVKNQGDLGSCTGHSSSGATESAFALLGQPLGFVPSELELYRGARAIERAQATPVGSALAALTDSGADTTDILTHMATYGVKARCEPQTSDGRNSDCEDSNVNTEATLADLEADALAVTVGPYAVDPSASDAEIQVQSALAAKIPVRVDAFVDTVFEDWKAGGRPIPAPDTHDPNGGGHAIYLVGWGTLADSIQSFYILRNSWGTSWGDGGDCLVSSAWLKSCWGIYPWTVKRSA